MECNSRVGGDIVALDLLVEGCQLLEVILGAAEGMQ